MAQEAVGLLFTRKNPPQTEGKGKPFRIELGWRGMFGLLVVCFCLFLWMFLLGIWAGQTILLPRGDHRLTRTAGQPEVKAAQTGSPAQQQ